MNSIRYARFLNESNKSRQCNNDCKYDCDNNFDNERECPKCHSKCHKDCHKCPKCNHDFPHDCC